MRLIALLLVFGFLLAGCTSTTGTPPADQTPHVPAAPSQNQSANASAPPANASAPSCEEYCQGLPHIQCVGSWNISGAYPSCTCSYECASESAGDNSSGGQAQPQEPLATPTNLSASQMLQAALDSQKEEFYRKNDGSYSEKTFTWLRETSGGAFGGMAPASDVLFDDNAIPTIQACGFVSFENTATGAREAYGAAIFNDTHTLLDSYTASDAFSLAYSPEMIGQELRDCWTYTKDFNIDENGGWLLTYYFRCERVIDK
jgi:hypothetical protein